MRKKYFLIAFFLVLLSVFYIGCNDKEKQPESIIAQEEILSENISTKNPDNAIKNIEFEFWVSFIFIFVLCLHIFIRKITFNHIHVRKNIKYRKQMPRGNLAFIYK